MSESVKQYVIVGNGVAGTMAAETLRKNDPSCRILLFADEPYPLYNRVGLPPMLKKKTPPEKVFMRSREKHEQLGIDLRLSTRVTAIHPEEKAVTDESGTAHRYDALLLATGGRPYPLQVPGGDLQHIYNFQTFDDTRAIMDRIVESKNGLVTGGSYIAYELAEGFHERGLHVTWLIRGSHFLRRVISQDGGALVDKIARGHGVEMVYGEEVAVVEGDSDGAVETVVTTGGKRFASDLVGVGLGLKTNTELAEAAGIQVNKGIVTNEYLETSVPGIYAGGDVAEFFDVTIQQHNIMGTWNNASTHGRVAGANMAGGRQVYREVPTYTTTMFHTRMSVAGVTPESKKDLDSISRVDMETDNFRQLFFWRNRLMGCVVIGDMKAKTEYTRLIQAGAEFPEAAERQRLLDL